MYIEDPQVTLLRNVRRLRRLHMEREGVGLKTLCNRAGVPYQSVLCVVRGRRWPRPETLAALAKALDVPVEVLFRR